jgi:ABC-2 type transport system ATP-binding protein
MIDRARRLLHHSTSRAARRGAVLSRTANGLSVIEVDSLTKHFGGYAALHGLTFSVRKGSVTGFLGQNGAGKTTTLRILACFLPPSSGSARVAGFDTVARSEEVRRRVGYLPESVPLYPELRVEEYLRFRARLKGVAAKEASAAVSEAASRCLLTEVLRRPIGNLSKGFRQRVGLADAIVHRPDVLILDEPTSGLDPTQRVEVRSTVKALGAERTVVVSTHILPEVEATCDHVVLLHRGTVAADRPLAELRDRGRMRLVFRGADLPDAIAEADGTRRCEAPDRETASRLAAEVVRRGGVLLELSPAVESLETVFARLTGGRDA